jgi:hypothetical protein
MKSPSRAAWVVTMLLLFGCALEGAPFPSSFRITGPGQFEFIARGNWINPANTTAGEAERLAWLSGYISDHQICPSGYTIVERTPQLLTQSPRIRRKGSVIRDDQPTEAVKYVGRCEPAS